jgi:beta-glucosidase
MMKKLSLLLAVVMLLSCTTGVFAENENWQTLKIAGSTMDGPLTDPVNYAVIDADETTGQKKLTYLEDVTPILEIDGLKFKDLNKNSYLDAYEDWRLENDVRIADLIAQMNNEELLGLLYCVNTPVDEARHLIEEFEMTCQLFNLNGNPISITNTLNNLQAKAESMRLGVPMVFTSDREYNSWGGYIDKSHEGFGTANDPELAAELAAYYAKAMYAIGVHVTFEPYANEIGAQYGENPELIASIISAEISALQQNGLASCTKHWIGRGGDSNFGNARSVAQNFDNWMVGWKAALDAGCEWIMTNCGGTGITNTVDVKFDPVTMGYLRDTLGFQGVIVTDWWPFGFGTNQVSGVTPGGVELADQSFPWLFNECLRNGVDMFGTETISHGTEITSLMCHWPDIILAAMETGEVQLDLVKRAATRILDFKFKKDLFENPYRDVNAAVELCASAEWAANPTEIHTNEDLRAARSPYEVELTERLQAKSAVLVKNDNNLLPLEKGIKVYLESGNGDRQTAYRNYVANFATLVDSVEEADVVIGDFSNINDTAELLIDDASYFDKSLVVTLNNTDPTQYVLENATAIIYMSYNQSADHGSTEAGFITVTEPWIYADILFGVREPGGVIVKEIARDSINDALQWKDLAGDQGADPYVRLMVQATMMADKENHASPNNWGDPLVQALYGMKYGEDPEFVYSCLILPQNVIQEETESRGSKVIRSTVVDQAKAGEPFTVYCLLNNYGADGITTVQAKANGEVVAEKIITVCADSWRVVQLDLTLEAGEYTIDIGGQSGNLIVE